MYFYWRKKVLEWNPSPQQMAQVSSYQHGSYPIGLANKLVG